MSIKRALIIVSDKSGIIEFSQKLASLNIEILSTGGTAKLLQENNIPVIEVSDYTGYPEMMDGRVKTLNPKIHGGILARRGIDEKVMYENEINYNVLQFVKSRFFLQGSAINAKNSCSFTVILIDFFENKF